MRPYLSDIEYIKLVIQCFSFWNHLDIESPRWVLSSFNSIEEILSCIIFRFGTHISSFLPGEVLDALVGFEVVLYIESFSLGIDPFESMRSISIHKSVSIRSSSIREEDNKLMKSLRCMSPKVKGMIRVLDVSLWISLLCMNEIREFYWISDKENRGIVSYHIIVSFFSIEFNSETSWISFSISSSSFSGNS